MREAGVGKEGALLVGLPSSRYVGPHGVGAQVENVAVATRSDDYRVGAVALEFSRYQVAGNDSACFAVDHYEVYHFVAGVHLDAAFGNLAFEGRVGSKQQLLAGLAFGIEGAAYLNPSKRAVVEQSAVVTGKGNPLRHALVNNARRNFGQAVYVGFAAAVVSALNGIVEQPKHGVAVVLVVFGGVDSALCSNGVGASRGILKAECLDVVAQFGKRCSRRRSG